MSEKPTDRVYWALKEARRMVSDRPHSPQARSAAVLADEVYRLREERDALVEAGQRGHRGGRVNPHRQAALTAGAWEDERSSVVPGGNAGELGLANVEEDRRAPGEATEHPANRGSSSLTAPAVSVVPCGCPPVCARGETE